MIDKDKALGSFTISCDEIGCGESETYYTDRDWAEFISDAKLDGWIIYKKGGDWCHRCPACAKDM
jgi:hypothetical protein